MPYGGRSHSETVSEGKDPVYRLSTEEFEYAGRVGAGVEGGRMGRHATSRLHEKIEGESGSRGGETARHETQKPECRAEEDTTGKKGRGKKTLKVTRVKSR